MRGLLSWLMLGSLCGASLACFHRIGKGRNFQLKIALDGEEPSGLDGDSSVSGLDGDSGSSNPTSGGGDAPEKSSGGVQNPLQDLVDALNVFKYPPDTYDEKGTAEKDGDLDCKFETQCCWNNVPQGEDQLEFFQARTKEGAVIPKIALALLVADILGDPGPEGDFIFTGSTTGDDGPEAQAEFKSCSVECVEADPVVHVKHWQTEDVILEVCKKSADDEALSDCQPLPREASPGPTTVTIPKSDGPFEIVIVAKNFLQPGVALIDDIRVDLVMCGTTPPPVAGNDMKLICQLECDFEEDTCDWEDDAKTPPGDLFYSIKDMPEEKKAMVQENAGDAPRELDEPRLDHDKQVSYAASSAMSANKEWSIRDGRYGNWVTGVHWPDPEDKGSTPSYLGSYQYHNTSAWLFSRETGFAFPHPLTVHFRYWEAVEHVQFIGCCNDFNGCGVFDSRKQDATLGVREGDNKWHDAAITCEAGTRRVMFGCVNNHKDARYEGACGLDSFRIGYYDPANEDGSQGPPTKPACKDGVYDPSMEPASHEPYDDGKEEGYPDSWYDETAANEGPTEAPPDEATTTPSYDYTTEAGYTYDPDYTEPPYDPNEAYEGYDDPLQRQRKAARIMRSQRLSLKKRLARKKAYLAKQRRLTRLRRVQRQKAARRAKAAAAARARAKAVAARRRRVKANL